MVCTSRSCEAYFKIKFMDGGLLTNTYRVYKPFTRVMSDIGGVKEVIYWVFFILFVVCGGRTIEKHYTVQKMFKIKAKKVPCKKSFYQKIFCCRSRKIKEINPRASYPVGPDGVAEAPEEIVDVAYEYFQDSKELIALAQGMLNLRFLGSLVFKDYQKSLVPLNMLNYHIKELEKQSKADLSKTEVNSKRVSSVARTSRLISRVIGRIVLAKNKNNTNTEEDSDLASQKRLLSNSQSMPFEKSLGLLKASQNQRARSESVSSLDDAQNLLIRKVDIIPYVSDPKLNWIKNQPSGPKDTDVKQIDEPPALVKDETTIPQQFKMELSAMIDQLQFDILKDPAYLPFGDILDLPDDKSSKHDISSFNNLILIGRPDPNDSGAYLTR